MLSTTHKKRSATDGGLGAEWGPAGEGQRSLKRLENILSPYHTAAQSNLLCRMLDMPLTLVQGLLLEPWNAAHS